MKKALVFVIAVVAAVLPVVVMPTAAVAASAPTYYPYGPQANVDESALKGWTQCWAGTYADNPDFATVLDGCAGDYMLLAAGPVGSTVFDVVAAAPRSDVLTVTSGNDTHDANGVGWYFDNSTFWGSWGFAKAGDPVDRVPCDIMGSWREDGPNGALRLCWHLFETTIQVGWRSGLNVDLNYSPDFRRAIYVPARDTKPPTVTCVATPASIWPPNHKLRDVTVKVTVTDDGSGPAGFQLVSVTSNEPDNGGGDGDTVNDIQGWVTGQSDVSGQLRAERSGVGTGRIYTLTYVGSDVAGNTAQCSATVKVPLNNAG